MIISPNRTEDMKARADMLECVEICLKHGLTDEAREIGTANATLKKRIDTHDYSKEDSFLKETRELVFNKKIKT